MLKYLAAARRIGTARLSLIFATSRAVASLEVQIGVLEGVWTFAGSAIST